jgi:hypothetical protein
MRFMLVRSGSFLFRFVAMPNRLSPHSTLPSLISPLCYPSQFSVEYESFPAESKSLTWADENHGVVLSLK